MSSESVYRRLQQHLDRMPVGFPATESGVEIRILERLFTPQEAEIALELSTIPEPAARIHRRLKTGMTLADFTKKLDEMAGKGLILGVPSEAGRVYGKLMWVIGIFERQMPRLTPELARDFFEYMQEGFGEAIHTKQVRPQLRTVPVHKSVPLERAVGSYDDLRG